MGQCAKHKWKLKDKNIKYSINFEKFAQAPSFNPVSNTCWLCLTEKYFIMFKPEGATTNHRYGFFPPVDTKTCIFYASPTKRRPVDPLVIP